MNVRTFINRPILSGVISVLMVLVGIIGLSQLPLEQFPEIAPPTVRIMASYTGANAETVQKSVIVPLEEAINGVEGMMYMTSSASNNGTGMTCSPRASPDPSLRSGTSCRFISWIIALAMKPSVFTTSTRPASRISSST